MNIPDGDIIAGDIHANYLGFDSENFYGNMYKENNDIYIVFIRSYFKYNGNVSKLIKNIRELGYNIHLVDPGEQLEKMAIRNNWIPSIRTIGSYGERIIWSKSNIYTEGSIM